MSAAARTLNVCEPSPRPDGWYGLEQLENAAPSTLHSKPVTASFAENAKLGDRSLLRAPGVESIVVTGAPVSTTHVKVEGEGSMFPAASTARTWKVWPPSTRLL